MTHCHHLVVLFSVPRRPECYVENTRGHVLTEMNDPITLLSGFKASVSVCRTGHMTIRWLTHTDRTGWGGWTWEWEGGQECVNTQVSNSVSVNPPSAQHDRAPQTTPPWAYGHAQVTWLMYTCHSTALSQVQGLHIFCQLCHIWHHEPQFNGSLKSEFESFVTQHIKCIAAQLRWRKWRFVCDRDS